MPGYTKLFSSIVHSTIWREELHVKVVWVTMLAMATKKGVVEASLPGLADAARVTLRQCQEAISKLSGPDKYSRTKEFEGRRIEECEGGWLILNHPKYRDLLDTEVRKEQVREAVQRHRQKRKAGNQNVISNHNVSRGKPRSSQATPTPESTPTTTTPSSAVGLLVADLASKLPGTAREALEALTRSAHEPRALLAEIQMILAGERGFKPTAEAVGVALSDCLLAGNRVTGVMLRAFVQRAMLGDRASGNGEASAAEWARVHEKAKTFDREHGLAPREE